MNKLIHRKSRKRLIYVVESKWWHPIYTPIKGIYIARIYKRVGPFEFARTRVRFAREQGIKPDNNELENLMREYG